MTRTQDDDVRGLLNSRSARSGLPAVFSPTPSAFSLTSPRPGLYTSPRPTERSSPSCYSRSQMSIDDSCSDISDDHPTTTYRSRLDRGSYVDPMRDSSEDERTDVHSDVQGSGSNDTLSETGMLRPVESDTSVSSALSVDGNTDPRMSYLGPKTRLISKAPWEEAGADEEAVSDTEAADTLSVFAEKLKGKARSRSKTLTQCKAEVERRFLGGGWGRTSSDTRPSMDSSKRSIEFASYVQSPTSPRTGSFSDAIRGVGARTPSLFSASSATSSGAQSILPGIRPRGGSSNAGIQISTYLDSRGSSPVSSSPTTPNFVHPYANLELLSAGASHDGDVSPSRSNSSATLTASTVSSYVTPSSTTSSATSPEQHEQPNSKKEKHRPPHIAVFPLNRGGSHVSSAKSPSALSMSFVPFSPTCMSGPSAAQEDIPAGMRVFPGSPAYNLIPLEQAQQAQIQMRARERSRSITSNTSQSVVSPRPKEVVHKKSKPALGPVGGGFSSVIGGGSPSPHWNGENARVRTVSAGSAPRGRSRGHTVTSVASQSTTSVNIMPGSAIENIPEPRSTGAPMETVPARQLKPKRSGFLKFWKQNGTGPGNFNISSPVGAVHVSHNGVDLPPPVPKVPSQYQTSRVASPPELGARQELPPVVVSPANRRTQSFERSQSVSDDEHTSIGDHNAQSRFHQKRANTEPLKSVEDDANPQDASFGLRLRPVSSVFKGMPEDYLTGSPKVAKSRGSGESRNGDSSGFEDSNVLSPITPYFPQSARSCRTHVSNASSGSDAFDPRTPSSLGFPPSVPRSSTDSQSTGLVASLREQIESIRKASQQQISDLQNQVESLKAELEASKCDRCGHNEASSIMNRPRAHTGTGCRTALGSSYD